MPEATAAAVVGFPDIQSAVDAVLATMQCAIPMARLELIDTDSIREDASLVWGGVSNGLDQGALTMVAN